MKRIFALLLCGLPLLVWAAIQFPPLSGRVVDNANMLSPAEEQQLTELLAAHEQRTTNQVVVVTLENLDGNGIEDYGYQLGRHWGIGQKDKDNGVLLIIAKEERKIRIEVGYGLEGELTDILSSLIIQKEIRPAFKQGQYSNGIIKGVTAILQVLDGNYVSPASVSEDRQDYRQQQKEPMDQRATALLLFCFFIFWILLTFLTAKYPWLLNSGNGGGGFNGRSGGGRHSGGGFSGGGGGFGGGGASGGW